jgi:1-acyl-sn-glycerol-3-phosphate acyltransferase
VWSVKTVTTMRDALRTIATVARFGSKAALALLLDPILPSGSTSTADGLPRVRDFCAATLRSLGIDLDVVGRDRVPSDGGVLFMWNQQSHLDHLLLGAAIPRPFVCLFNNEVMRTPIYGAHLRRNGHFHVDRNDASQWRPAIARAADALREGTCVLVSPEGTRGREGRLLPMKRGAFLLARLAERPIVTVTLIDAWECLPRDASIVRPGRVRVVLGEPIDVRGDDETLEARVTERYETTMRDHATIT